MSSIDLRDASVALNASVVDEHRLSPFGDRVRVYASEAIERASVVIDCTGDGDVFVVKAGPTLEVSGRFPMGEPLMATPALAGDTMFVRGERHLFAIAKTARIAERF